jgi:DNA (cytosine-5)-methyltransferase 1
VLCDLGSPTAPPRDASLPGDLHAERKEHENVRALLDALPIDENACYANIRAKIRKKHPISRAETDMNSGAEKFAQLIFRRLNPDRPACSFTTQFRPDGFQGRVVHPKEARVCTPAEALSCLGFKVSSLPHAKLSIGHRLAGNAFSPLVTKAIFDAICTPLEDRSLATENTNSRAL